MWYTMECHCGTQWNASHKKEQNNGLCSDMDATRDSHKEKDKYHMISLDVESKIWHKEFPL